MTDAALPTLPPPSRRRYDRFVAFAFAGGDLLLEVDATDRVAEAYGVARSFTGGDTDALRGASLFDVFGASSHSVVREALNAMRAGRRVRTVPVHSRRVDGRELAATLSGYRLPELQDHVFLSVNRSSGCAARGYASRSPGGALLDRHGFEAVARELLDAGLPESGAVALTLIEVPEVVEIGQRLGSDAMERFVGELEHTLRDLSVGGDSAADLGAGRYGLLHDAAIDPDAIRGRVRALKQDVDPENLVASMASAAQLALDADAIDSAEAVNALIYTVNGFAHGEAGMSINALMRNYRSKLSDTVREMVSFKQMVRGGHFHLVYQPIVDLWTAGVHHFECLTRLDDAKDSSPFRMVSFAEDVGLIGSLDIAVLQRAIDSLRSGAARNPALRLAINISGRSLSDPETVQRLMRIVEGAADLPSRLLFEVTESAEIANLEAANAVIQEWRYRGHAVCLDDFGAGAAAFHYLRALNVDYVKIDGTYVRGLHVGPKNVPFLRAIVQLCRELKMETIAEFVETEETASLLRAIGVRYGQGWLFGKPIRPDPILPLADDWLTAEGNLCWRNGLVFCTRDLNRRAASAG